MNLREELIDIQDTINELTATIQELQNEVNCLNDSRAFQDAESVCSGYSHVTSQPVFFTLFPDPGGNAQPFYRNAEPQRWAARIFGIRMVYRETFFSNPTASSSAPYPQEPNPWISNVSEHTSPHVMSERQNPDFQSSSVRETLQRIVGQTNDDCRFQIFILVNSPHQERLLVGRYGSRPRYVLVHNFLRKRCNGSKKWSWLIQWMISNLRVLSEDFKHQILKYSMRGLLRH